ncbi:flagellar hook-basal body complex protein FliE [Arsenophonus endosymbiont of Aleurodicus floccissimus]|nr:flagellar hook-basal body complex protein FliE [Arsenophonus endosymbiont of Aleurodicus floccissimus]
MQVRNKLVGAYQEIINMPVQMAFIIIKTPISGYFLLSGANKYHYK